MPIYRVDATGWLLNSRTSSAAGGASSFVGGKFLFFLPITIIWYIEMDFKVTATSNGMTNLRPFQEEEDIEHAKVPDMVRLKKTISRNQISSSIWLKRWIRCDFPLFTDEIMKAYHEHNIANINPFIFTPIILLYNSYIACCSGLVGLRFGKIQNFDRHIPYFMTILYQ